MNSKLIRLFKFSFVFLFMLCCSFINANAECQAGEVLISKTQKEDGSWEEVCSSTRACKSLYDSNGNVNITAVSDKYQPKLTKNANNTWKVTINPADANDASVLNALKDVRFKLISVNNRTVTEDKYVSYNSPLNVNKQLDSDGYMTLRFKIDKEHLDPQCKSEFLEFVIELFDGGDPTSYNENVPDIPPVGVPAGTVIDCSVSHATGSFGAEFCKAKQNASINYANRFNSSSGTVKKYKDVFGSNNAEQFTCNNTTIRSQSDIARIGEDGYYLSENTNYMFGSGDFTLNNGNYKYRYSPCNPKTGAAVTCKVRCEEAVVVQYGAPIASKAGLCFEYKVKVTSRVSCEMVETPPLPDKVTTVCTPTPTCTGIGRSGSRYYLTEGGPNEDFHACIEACDGGKYTSKCSKQCYKDVYQNALITYKGSKTASSKYYCQSGGYVSWHGGGPGRYYGNGCKSEYEPDGNGICRHHYSNGTVCQDDCWWNACPSGVYLNPGYSSEDYQNNMDKYNAAIQKCTAAAKCSTSQAEFTITVDYKDESNTVRTINFPYDQNLTEFAPSESTFKTDKLCSKAAVGCTPSHSANNSTILKFDGCYKTNPDTETIYFSEWGFPSSWLNRKTGELSYLNKKGQPGWQEIKDKFCIPFNAQEVNEEWWRYYYKSLGQTINCDASSTVEKYNIRAKATDFGYFGWNIGVKCFYAIGDDYGLGCPTAKELPEVSYVIRSVDLDNLFPAVDGSELSSSNDVGRTPGFNWSSGAKNEKNIDYTSNPSAYAKYIQDKGYSIYNDENLDYEFYLSPDILRRLKGSRKDYTLYNGTSITDSHGVIRYKSDLFRAGGIASDSKTALKIPEESQIRCNNLSSGGCQTS